MTDRKSIGFFALAGRIISKLEQLPLSPPLLAAYIAFLLTVRELLEQGFFESRFSIFQFDHHVFFYLLMLLVGILGISWIGKMDIVRTTRVVAAGYVLIIVPPLIDRFLAGRVRPYDYVEPGDFLNNLATLFTSASGAGPGIRFEIALILLLASAYVFVRSRSFLRAALTGLFLYLSIALSVTPRFFLPLTSMRNPNVYQARHILYFSYFLVLCVAAGGLFLRRIQPGLPKAVFKETRSFRTLHGLAMVGAGIYARNSLDWLRFPDVLYVFISFALIGVIWTATVLINNVFDLPIDRLTNPDRPLVRQAVLPSHYLHLAFVLTVIAIYVSLVQGRAPLLITVVSLSSAWAYSAPPIRLRDRLFSNVFIAWGSVLAFALGYFAASGSRPPAVTPGAAKMALVIFLALFLGSFTKDIKDYRGDLAYGVKTVVTRFGLRTGRKIAAGLLFLSLSTPLILFSKPIDAVVMPSAAALASLLFWRYGRLWIAYAGYGMVFLYCLARLAAA